MTAPGRDDLDRELQRFLLQERDPWQAFEASSWAQDPAARLRMEQFMALTDTLDAFGVEQQTELARLEQTPVDPAHLEEVRSILHAELDTGSAAESDQARGFSRRGWLTAAGVALCAGLFWRVYGSGAKPQPDPDPMMGTLEEDFSPLGTQQSFEEFRWPAVPRAQGYRVTVLDEEGNQLDRSPIVEVTTWKPEDTSSWPNEIFWQVWVRTTRGDQDLPAGGSLLSARRSR